MDILWILGFAVLAYVLWELYGGTNRVTSSGPLCNVPGPGNFDTEVVGESNYQHMLEHICGGRSEDGVNKEVQATLILEDDNPHDNKAVRVDVTGYTVGYLPRADARSYRNKLKRAGHPRLTVTCAALITGGWDRGGDDRGYFGISLDLPERFAKGVLKPQ